MRIRMCTALLAVATLATAQKAKSNAEAQGINGIIKEQDPATVIKDVDAFIQKFADTPFKGIAYTHAAQAAQMLNDGPKIIIYSDLAIEADPKAYEPMLLESAELARSTRENDLDKEDKLTKAEKLAHTAIEVIPGATKPNPTLTDAQWEEFKKELTADGHRDLGMIATVRKKYDVAVAEFKQAVELPAQPDPATFIRLATAYDDNKQPDEALAVLAKMPANPQLAPFANREKARAEALKAAKK